MSLLHDKIEERRGNYVLTIGFPAAGKTVLQSWLTRYVMAEGPYQTQLDNVDSERATANYDANRIVNEWMEQWNEGRFPKPNPVGEDVIREINLRVKPMYGVKTPLEFGFLEISGEMMESVIPGETENPSLSKVLLRFLSNSKLNLVIILLVDPASDDNNKLFFNFLNFLDVNLPYDIREQASLALVVSKPEVAMERLRAHAPRYAAHAEMRGEIVEDFVETFVPSIYSEWYEWPEKRRVISRFYVGEIERDERGAYIAVPSFTSAENLFGWIYKQFTGHEPGPGFFGKAWKWIRK